MVPAPAQQLVLLAVDPKEVQQPGVAAQEAAQQAAAAIGAADAAEAFDDNFRSMEAAVANLARFTSDEPAGATAIAAAWIWLSVLDLTGLGFRVICTGLCCCSGACQRHLPTALS